MPRGKPNPVNAINKIDSLTEEEALALEQSIFDLITKLYSKEDILRFASGLTKTGEAKYGSLEGSEAESSSEQNELEANTSQSATSFDFLSEEEKSAFAKAILKVGDDILMGEDSVESAFKNADYTSQTEALVYMLLGRNVFLSGPAGSGKSAVIKKYLELIEKLDPNRRVAVTATTGMAATLVGGRTIHSFSGLTKVTERVKSVKALPYFAKGAAAEARYQNCDVLIIDEISMMPAYFLDNLNFTFKRHKHSTKPFGGTQVIFIGDFNQLPPVPERNPDGEIDQRFCFHSNAWKNSDLVYCYLDKVHRSKDDKLKFVLDTVLSGQMTPEALKLLDARMNIKEDGEKTYTRLYSTNRNVYFENMKFFNKIKKEPIQYKAKVDIVKPDEIDYNQALKDANTSEYVSLKKGAKVIVTANLSAPEVTGGYDDAPYVGGSSSNEKVLLYVPNGTVAKVVAFKYYDLKPLKGPDDKPKIVKLPIIRLNNGSHVVIEKRLEVIHGKKRPRNKEDQEAIENGEDKKQVKDFVKPVIATVEYMPLKLGWAITVHKSQGNTYDGVVTDLTECFAPGLGYVALSRVRSLDDLILLGYNDSAFYINPDASDMNKRVKEEAKKARAELIKDRSEIMRKLEEKFGRH